MIRESRNEIYRWLRRCLIGPANPGASGPDSDSLNRIRPLERFQTGILFPVSIGESGLDAAEPETDDEEELTGDEENAGTEASGLSRPKRTVLPPSSVGFSFFVQGDSIEIQLIPRAVRYELPEDRTEQGRFAAETWRRVPLGRDDSEGRTLPTPDRGSVHHWREPVFDLFQGRAPRHKVRSIDCSATTRLPRKRIQPWHPSRIPRQVPPSSVSC